MLAHLCPTSPKLVPIGWHTVDGANPGTVVIPSAARNLIFETNGELSTRWRFLAMPGMTEKYPRSSAQSAVFHFRPSVIRLADVCRIHKNVNLANPVGHAGELDLESDESPERLLH
jgi:hypothetical protein